MEFRSLNAYYNVEDTIDLQNKKEIGKTIRYKWKFNSLLRNLKVFILKVFEFKARQAYFNIEINKLSSKN